jgi:hypothetical protein
MVTEEDLDLLRASLVRVLGERAAETLMELLAPHSTRALARQRGMEARLTDLDRRLSRLSIRLDRGLDELAQRLDQLAHRVPAGRSAG